MITRRVKRCGDAREVFDRLATGIRRAVRATVRRAHNAPFSATALCLALVSLVIVPVVIFMNLGRGLDVSDTGYYLSSIRRLGEITMQTTQFAVVWNLIPLPDSVVAHRIALLLLFLGSGGGLALASTRLVRGDGVSHPGADSLAFLSGAASTTTYYFLWLPDPSYNAVAMILAMSILALTCELVLKARTDGTCRTLLALAFMVGLFGLLLAITRPPSAVAAALVSAALVLTLARARLLALMSIAGAALMGAASAIGLLAAFVEPPWQTLGRLLGGIERREILQVEVHTRASFDQYIDQAVASYSLAQLLVASLFLVSVGVNIRLNYPSTRILRPILCLGVLASFVAVLALEPMARTLFDSTLGGSWNAMASFVSHVGALGVLTTLLNLALPSPGRPFAMRQRTAMVVFAILFAQLGLVVGTGNSWWIQATLFGGMPLIAWVALNAGLPRFAPNIQGVFAVPLILACQVFVWQLASSQPYRLPAPLAAQTIPTNIMGQDDVVLTDPATHSLLAAFSESRALIDPNAPPVLLDLTGAMPLVALHIGARLPGVPWQTDGLPGSQDFFDYTVAQLSDRELAAAWILYPTAQPESYSPRALEARGVSIPGDYDVIAAAYAPYPGTPVELLAPRGSAQGIRPTEN